MRTDSLPDLECACANLRRATRVMTRLYDRALAGTGLGVAQFTLLHVLEQQGGNPMMQSALGEVLSLDSTTLTRTLAPLARRGCVRGRPGADRRERLWVIAPKGKRELERARPRWERVQKLMRSRLGTPHWDTLLDETKRVAIAARMRTADGLRPEKDQRNDHKQRQ